MYGRGTNGGTTKKRKNKRNSPQVNAVSTPRLPNPSLSLAITFPFPPFSFHCLFLHPSILVRSHYSAKIARVDKRQVSSSGADLDMSPSEAKKEGGDRGNWNAMLVMMIVGLFKFVMGATSRSTRGYLVESRSWSGVVQLW